MKALGQYPDVDSKIDLSVRFMFAALKVDEVLHVTYRFDEGRAIPREIFPQKVGRDSSKQSSKHVFSL
jgi:hypothetical protein